MSRKLLEKTYFKALNKVKAKNIVKDNVSLEDNILIINNEKIDLNKIDNLYVFSVGKAGFSMAKQCEKILGNKIKDGVAISTSRGKLKCIKHYTSSHPVVSKKSIKVGEKLLKKVKQLKKNDYFIFFLSGGASAVIEKPIDGLNLEDFTKISKALLVSGIDIKALNSVRKSISQIKGGKLANEIKANGKVLVLSDVIGDDINTIGSAPMNNGKFEHKIIGNNEIALKASKKYIESKVDKTKILTTTLDKNSIDATKYIKQKIKKYDEKYDSFCLLIGGETTTNPKGNGKGGRNQELALRLLLEKVVNKKISLLCAGSDGIDGNSDANGAFVDNDIYKKINELKIDAKKYLENSDSNSFFKSLGYDFTIGITGTNVMDFIIVIKER
jgi:glycerate-2-kinase